MDLGRGPSRRTRASTALTAVALTTLVTGAGVAAGKDGGIGAPDPPAIRDATCVEKCLDVRAVAEGGVAALSGQGLSSIVSVRMPDAKPVAVKGDDKQVEFDVPAGATTGAPVAIDRGGNRYRAPVDLVVKPADSVKTADGFRVRDASAAPRKSYFNGKKRAAVDYLFEADGPADVRVDVTRKNKLVDSFVEKHQQPFTQQHVAWNGLTDSGRVAKNGNYEFRISPLSGGDGGSEVAFSYHDHKFPLRARHSYGDGLGAGRNHMGQDVFAKCGAPIVAARGGRVQAVQFQSSAGYYVVVDGAKTGVDYVYMHLNRKGRPKKGAKVKTGERIGFNDDTGNADGCHLHFEMWSAPGWYEGGHVLNPTRPLKKWDGWS